MKSETSYSAFCILLLKYSFPPPSPLAGVSPDGWVVKLKKATRFTVITDSKREAITIARNMARTKKTQLVVHGKNGLIELKESYVA